MPESEKPAATPVSFLARLRDPVQGLTIPYYRLLVYVLFLISFTVVVHRLALTTTPDSADYLAAAKAFRNSWDVVDIVRQPRGASTFSYCLVLGVYISLFGEANTVMAYWFNLSICFAALVLLLQIVRRITDDVLIATLAGIMFALSFEILIWSKAMFLTDTFFMTVMGAYVLTLYRYAARPAGGRLVVCTLALAALVFAKSVALFFVPVHLVVTLWYASRSGRKSFAAQGLATVLALAALLGVKFASHGMNQYEASMSSRLGGMYYQGHIFYEQSAHPEREVYQYDTRQVRLYEPIDDEGDPSIGRFLLKHPLKAAMLWGYRLWFFWKPYMPSFRKSHRVWNFFTLFIPELLALVGIAGLLQRRRYDLKYWIPLLMMLANSGGYAFTWIVYERRFLMPLLPFVYIYAAFGVVETGRYARGLFSELAAATDPEKEDAAAAE